MTCTLAHTQISKIFQAGINVFSHSTLSLHISTSLSELSTGEKLCYCEQAPELAPMSQPPPPWMRCFALEAQCGTMSWNNFALEAQCRTMSWNNVALELQCPMHASTASYSNISHTRHSAPNSITVTVTLSQLKLQEAKFLLLQF